MKTRVSKSDVFKRAWAIFKSSTGIIAVQGTVYDFNDFSDCLKRAWAVEKANVKSNIKKLEVESKRRDFQVNKPQNNISLNMVALTNTLTDYYANNRFSGD